MNEVIKKVDNWKKHVVWSSKILWIWALLLDVATVVGVMFLNSFISEEAEKEMIRMDRSYDSEAGTLAGVIWVFAIAFMVIGAFNVIGFIRSERKIKQAFEENNRHAKDPGRVLGYRLKVEADIVTKAVIIDICCFVVVVFIQLFFALSGFITLIWMIPAIGYWAVAIIGYFNSVSKIKVPKYYELLNYGQISLDDVDVYPNMPLYLKNQENLRKLVLVQDMVQRKVYADFTKRKVGNCSFAAYYTVEGDVVKEIYLTLNNVRPQYAHTQNVTEYQIASLRNFVQPFGMPRQQNMEYMDFVFPWGMIIVDTSFNPQRNGVYIQYK